MGCRLFAGFGVSGVSEGSGPSAGPGVSVGLGVSGDSGCLFGIFESPGGSGVGSGPASGDGSGAGSSKAGRAWCQGASVLRGGREALPGGLSPGWEVARWSAELSDALRVRRGSADVVEGPGSVADGSGSVAGGWELVAVAAGSDSVAWGSVPGVVDPGSVDVWLAEPSAAVRVRRGAAGDSEGVSPVVA